MLCVLESCRHIFIRQWSFHKLFYITAQLINICIIISFYCLWEISNRTQKIKRATGNQWIVQDFLVIVKLFWEIKSKIIANKRRDQWWKIWFLSANCISLTERIIAVRRIGTKSPGSDAQWRYKLFFRRKFQKYLKPSWPVSLSN